MLLVKYLIYYIVSCICIMNFDFKLLKFLLAYIIHYFETDRDLIVHADTNDLGAEIEGNILIF